MYQDSLVLESFPYPRTKSIKLPQPKPRAEHTDFTSSPSSILNLVLYWEGNNIMSGVYSI